ncbi:tyrosine-type recombinase/integrase [Dyella sp. KRB-257]|uniref:tyrosine-type recombinase/integrase n=1 Tax=Dyella sp. KRB-257 TaxID=3400915 RepID=UPI003C08253D
MAEEWLAKQAATMAPATMAKARWTFDDLVFPWIGSRPIAEIDPPEMLVLRRIEERGAHETAHRTKQRCGQVFRYAIATHRAKHDPTTDLRGALTAAKVEHRPAITDPARIGELLRAIDGYTGGFVVRCALRLAPLVFTRPGELRKAEWAEIDMDAALWRIPAERMKMREPHTVPLAPQAVAVLRELQPLTGNGRYVFPSARTTSRPMSDAAVNAALRRMGFDKDTMTGHGFRALASSRLNELGWAPDVIERQLAHAERNKVRAAYNRAQYMEERQRMMQAWADYLDGLRTGADVVAFKRKAV